MAHHDTPSAAGRRSERQPYRGGFALLALWLTAAPPALAQSAELLSDQAGATVALNGESLLVVEGVTGSVSLRTGRPGELRYETRAQEDRRVERPVALWRDGAELRLTGPGGEGEELEPVQLELAVPPELAVSVGLFDSRLHVGGLHSDLELVGQRLQVDARGLRGAVSVELEGSTLTLDGVEGDVWIQASEVEGAVRRVGGALTLTAAKSRLELLEIGGATELELDETALRARGFSNAVSARAHGGSLELSVAAYGVELWLEQTPLMLVNIEGRARVETDADLQFRDLKAELTITSYGGAVRGSANAGSTQINADRSPVALNKMEGAVRVIGDGLSVKLSGIQGDLDVRTTSSEVEIDQAEGPLNVVNDWGNLTIRGAAKEVKVLNREGDVELRGAAGAVELRADGGRVTVDWASITPTANQLIENESGEIVAAFPSKVSCRVEAESLHGRVDSALPAVVVADDERSASGALGGATHPLVKLRSAGDVIIVAASGN